jgi:hypothetical protein
LVNLYTTLDDRYVQWMNFCSHICNNVDCFMLSVSYQQKFQSKTGARERERERERESVCVCVCERERERARVIDGFENCVSTFLV